MHRVREILSCSFVDHDPLSTFRKWKAPLAKSFLSEVFDYYSGGAWDLQTLHENQVLSSLSTCRLEDVAAAASGPLASGANAVLVGRPVLWGLATGGESGVAEALEMLRKEFDLAMALSGCASLDDITPDLLGRA